MRAFNADPETPSAVTFTSATPPAAPQGKEVSIEEAQKLLAEAAQPATEGGIEFDLETLIKQGVLEREVEIMPNVKVTMHVLGHPEQKVASAMLPQFKTEDGNINAKYLEEMKVPTLHLAITKMGTKDYSDPISKKTLKDLLSRAPGPFIDLLYMHYQSLVADQLEILSQGVKKNSQ